MTGDRGQWYAALAERLEGGSKAFAGVVPTRNRVRMVSFRQGKKGVEVRVSVQVADLGTDSLDAVEAFVRGDAGGRAALRELFQKIPSAPAQLRGGISAGTHHDLAALAELELTAHFEGLTPCPVI